jgi:hypothetical protein
VASCNTCHDVHSGEVQVSATTCGKCHSKADGTPVASFDELKATRQYGFAGDIDGDGTVEPLADEIAGLQATLLAAIQSYAVNVAGQPGICFSDANYPYFLKHAGASGDCTAAEITAAAAYKAFTPRLMRAAYNLKFSVTDYGAWAHNPRYAIEILYDAITDLNAGLAAASKPTVAFSGRRAFSDGHFGAATPSKPAGGDAFNHWAPPTMFASAANAPCAQCHSGQVGLGQYLSGAATNALLTASSASEVNAFQCATCHAFGTDMKGIRTDVKVINFPPQKSAGKYVQVDATTAFAKPADRVCSSCHTARENKTSIDDSITAKYGLSTTSDLTATAGTTTSVTVPSTGWTLNQFKSAVITFTGTSANAGFSAIVTGTTATAGGASTITFAPAAATAAIAGDTLSLSFTGTFVIGFTNPHYLGAAGVMFASNAHMMYEYPGKTYATYPAFWQADLTKTNGPHGSPHAQSCTSCHNPQGTQHSFEVDTATSIPAGTFNGATNTQACDQCHVASSHGDFRLPPLKANVQALSSLLYATIQAYAQAANTAGVSAAKPVCYSDAYPYWYDATATTNCTANLTSANGAKFDDKLARAAFNYKWSVAEPGAYAHNYEYMVQAVVDSIQDLNPSATLPCDAHDSLCVPGVPYTGTSFITRP